MGYRTGLTLPSSFKGSVALGSNNTERRSAYRDLFKIELDPEVLRDIRTSTHGGYVIGNQHFREQIEQMLRQRATPRERGRPRKQTVAR